MRTVLPVVFVILSFLASGCSRNTVAPSPAAKTFNPSLFIYVAGYVVTSDHQCIVGAVVDIPDSEIQSLIGRRIEQRACDFDNGIGYDFGPVPAGTRVRVRASAAGYQTQQRDIIVGGRTSTIFMLTAQ